MKHNDSDMTVQPDDTRSAFLRNRALGWEAATNELAEIEPAMLAFILAVAWKITDGLTQQGIEPDVIKKMEREIGLLAIASVEAQRTASARLWNDLLPEMEVGNG